MRKPGTVLAAALALLAAAAALLLLVLLRTDGQERRQAERRFTDRAATSAALTSSLFGATASANQATLAGPLGRTRSGSDLDRVLQNTGTVYSALLDARGRVLAFGSGVTRANRERITATPLSVLRVIRGQVPYDWSEPLTTADGPVVEVVTRVNTAAGPRVALRGYPLKNISPFIGRYLNSLPDSDQVNDYVVDGSGGVIAAAVQGQRAPGRLADRSLEDSLGGPGAFGAYADDRHYAIADVKGTSWRVVVTESDAVLYAGTGGIARWILYGLAVLAATAAIVLTLRVAQARSRLRRAYERLEEANEELRRSNAELDEFAAAASHDLQEPLRKIVMFGDRLKRRHADEFSGEAGQHLHRMRDAASRMSVLIEDLLAFSRVTTRARDPREVDLDRVAREVVVDLEARREATNGTVTIGPLPSLVAEPHQMRQLLQNLIGNGLKFHRAGVPPVVGVEATEPPDADHVAFAVTDNGIGFEPVYAERIFGVFERLHPRDVYEGTGIGLALCRKIVERHGGTIVAAGEQDAGARFLVILPARQSASRREPEAGSPTDREPVGV